MTKINKQYVPVFIGSTYEDLIEYRQAVRDVLVRLETIVHGMEYFGSLPGSPLEECLNKVRQSKIYIGIFAMRYGSIESNSGKSFTHLEFEEAQRLKLPSLIYLIDENKQPVLPKFIDTGESATKLKELKNYLKNRFTLSYFTTTDDLAKKISQDLPRLLSKNNIEIAKESNKDDKDIFDNNFDFIKSAYNSNKTNKGLRLIITDRNSWLLEEVIDTLEWQNYGILAPSSNNDYFETFHKNRIYGSSYDRYTIYYDPNIIEECQCVIYIEGLSFELNNEKREHSLYKYLGGVYTPMLAYLIRAETLGKRIIYISDSHSMQLNGLKDFVFHNIGNKRNNEYEQISHPSFGLHYDRERTQEEEKTEEHAERKSRLKNSLGKILDNFDNELLPISISTFARNNKLKNVAIIYNPNNNFSNIEFANILSNMYSYITYEPLHFNEHQNSSLIDYLKGSEQGLAKLIESIIFCIPKLKEMKLKRLRIQKEIENLTEDIRAKKISSDFAEQDNAIKLVNSLFDCMDKADNETKILIANKLLIEKKLGITFLSEKTIEPTDEHIDIQ